MSKFLSGILFAFLTPMPVVGAADDAPSFQYLRPIETPVSEQDEVFAVSLDSDIYAATRDGFSDLRVLDAVGPPLPILIRPAAETRTTKVQKVWTAADPALKPIGDEGLEIRFTLRPKDPAPVITPGPGGRDAAKSSEMCLIRLPGAATEPPCYRMFYEACDGTAPNSRGVWRIASATSDVNLPS